MKSYVEIKLVIEQNLLQAGFTYYKFLVPTFRTLNPEFTVKVNGESYQEFMTNLTGCGFINTLEFLSEQTSLETTEQLRPYFESIDYQFGNTLAQTYQSLQQVQNQVVDDVAYLNDLESWQIKIYQDFFEMMKSLLYRDVLPTLLNLILKFQEQGGKPALFQHQINEFFFAFKNKLSSKNSELLATYLTKIYAQYQPKVSFDDQFQAIEAEDVFSDFSDFSLIRVVDVNSALNIFGLQKNTNYQEIQQTYKQLAKKYHPDSQHFEANPQKMNQINLAYQILKTEYQPD